VGIDGGCFEGDHLTGKITDAGAEPETMPGTASRQEQAVYVARR
jgi:hypothetical protein